MPTQYTGITKGDKLQWIYKQQYAPNTVVAKGAPIWRSQDGDFQRWVDEDEGPFKRIGFIAKVAWHQPAGRSFTVESVVLFEYLLDWGKRTDNAIVKVEPKVVLA